MPVFSQIGGKNSFEFLNIPTNARLASLGGVNTSLADRDVNFFFSNPSLVSDSLAGWGSAGYQFYVADIGQAAFSYADRFGKAGFFALGVQHVGYGSITQYDAGGNELGNYKSSETAIVLSKSHTVSNYRLGASFKIAFSNLAGYSSQAVMVDFGGVFIHPKKDLRVGLTIKNAGVVLSTYTGEKGLDLPFDVQAGATFKPQHMPLRFSLTAYNLFKKDVASYDYYDNTTTSNTMNKVLRRINFGAELLFHKNASILVGYNYLAHQQLKLPDAGGGAGVCLGLSLNVKSFEFVFSRSSYGVRNAGYSFTLSTDIKSKLTRR